MSEKIVSKTISHKVLIKTKYNNFLLNNVDQSLAIDKIMDFCRKYYIFCVENLDDYEQGQFKKDRIIRTSFIRFLCFSTAIRFFISSLSSERWVIIFMSDANYLLGNRSLISMVISMGSLIVVSIGAVIQYQELSQTLKLMDFLNGYKKRSIISLNALNTRRLALSVNLMTKFFVRQAFWPLVLLSFGLISSSTVIAYFDQRSGFVALSLFVWNLFLFAFFTQLYALVSIGFVIWTLSSLYLKYKFNEVSDRIAFALRAQNKNELMSAISEHNSVSKQTEDLNEFFSKIIFVLYYFASPTLMILLYITGAEDTHTVLRFVAVFVFLIVFLVVFGMNLFSSLISGSSRKPRKLFFDYLFRNNFNPMEGLKVMAFIEKLSGPDIGFYCWNLFPMNNYRFYKYVVSCAITYFLILDLI